VRVAFVVNSDWFFLSHRLPLARALRDRGAEVTAIAVDYGEGARIRAEGIGFVPLPISRKGTNPLQEIHAIRALAGIYRDLEPDLVHHVTIKPVVYGSIAARLAGRPAVVNAVTGLGYVFSEGGRARLLRPPVKALYRTALQGSRTLTIFQNPDDHRQFVESGLVRADASVLIRGSGVDGARFQTTPEVQGDPVFVLPARLIWDKGVGEFVAAARLVKQSHPRARFALVGRPDDGNPRAVPEAQLRAWNDEGVVEWWGYRSDMPAVINSASAVVLPTTYREGVPKVLLEAAAAGRPIVTTDMPGCREIVRPGINGLLVPPGNVPLLAQAIRTLLASGELRRRFGQAGRALAMEEFSEASVVERTLQVYQRLLPGSFPEPVEARRAA
jgi:glycosyltransferase involved in cell wall biosynthesis